MKNILAAIVFTLAATQCAYAQFSPASERPYNMLSAELYGNGIIGSFNYERRLTDDINVRVGSNGPVSLAMVNFYPEFAHIDFGVGVIGTSSHWNEILELNDGKKWSPTAALNIHLTKMNGLYVKFALVTYKVQKYVPFFGISLGYGF